MRRALLSVSDKTGLHTLARGLLQAGFQLISTGGTLASLQGAGITATAVSEVTGFPEILDGRVKTLHPAVHAGILAGTGAVHRAQIAELDIAPIDVVVVNLYPFQETAERPGATLAEAVEQIDIGGPAMLRAAAKNFERVWVLVDPADYEGALAAIAGNGGVEQRLGYARKAFAHTARYDHAIASYLAAQDDALGATAAVGATTAADALATGPAGATAGGPAHVTAGAEPEHGEPLPRGLTLVLERAETLRYGENPHQAGARYRQAGERSWWDEAVHHKGTSLSYLNVFDCEAAWRLVHEFDEPACVIVKHANPCGVAVADNASDAYRLAYEADPKSAFGGVVALNRPVDGALATAIMGNAKADLLIARSYEEEALTLLRAKRKAMRVLSAPSPGAAGLEFRRVGGGFLVQEPDSVEPVGSRLPPQWRVVTRAQPTDEQLRDLAVAWTVCARTSSNAIVLVRDRVAVGIGAGQQSRVDAAELAARKAAGRAEGGACASDAFYPFRDGLDAAAAAGVATVVQPGGSVRDDEVIAAADEHGIAMVFTGRRHFRH